MNSIIERVVGIAAASTIGLGGLAVMAPDVNAYSKGTVTRSEGRKVVREADWQQCLTMKEIRKIVKGSGSPMEGGRSWKGRGKVDFLGVEHYGKRCAVGVYLIMDNGDTLSWVNGQINWA